MLAEIFVEGLEIWSLDIDEEKAPFEVMVSHVSCRWREVAINLAALWSTIYVAAYQPLDMLEAYLVRSKRRLLDIDVQIDQYPNVPAEG